MPQPARAILIAGPTASGKSALAQRLAAKSGGTVVNANSMQVYAGLQVLAGAPSAADLAQAPHRLYGHIDPARAYSVGDWLGEVADVLQSAHAGPLIIVGGTGLYFHALTNGIVDVPDIPADLRAALRDRAAGMTAPQLHAELARRDPEMAARLRPSDPQRTLRALEVIEATGRSLAVWQEASPSPLLPPEQILRIVLTVPRAELHRRIEQRFATMLTEGALDEVAALGARGLAPDLPAMKALGVEPLLRHLAGTLPREEAIAEAVQGTRRYAKRQDTWARHRLADWPRAVPEEAMAVLSAALKDVPASTPP